MAGRIPQQFIDELLARTDIVDLIDGFVPLKKAGKDFQACCPFHDEKTPSFTVSQPKQFYHCFGCGVKGTAISFLMEYNHLEFLEAIEELANKAGLPIPQEASLVKTDSNLSELYELLELVVRFYNRQLREHPQSKRAVDYLKDRGISGEIAKSFELGFAPPGWDNLIQELGSSEAAKQRLAKTGMVIKRDNGGFYDRFRDRIMFPIRDPRGRVIGFGGRVLDDDTPKYLNSPETPIYSKGRELYGLYQARHANKDLQRIYVVEGYMDVIALAQFGINNAVASLGTAATSEHLERLFRATPEVVFCFDGDNAGRKAAWRAMETTLPLIRDGRQAFFMFMPQGEDPDTFVRSQGRESFEDTNTYLALSDYLFDSLKQNTDLNTTQGQARMMEEVIPFIRQMPDGALRKLMVRDLANLVNSDSDYIESALGSGTSARRSPSRPVRRQQNSGSDNLIGRMISMLLYQPDLALRLDDYKVLEGVPVAGVDFLLELLQLIQSNRGISCAGILEHWRDTRYEACLKQLAASNNELFSVSTNLEAEFDDALARLLDKKSRQKLQQLATGKLSSLSEEDKATLRNYRKTEEKN
ncbi:MAG: DNA primase [Gammaproteobacteria bacterium]|nr:DNA primase [Gammaproteobacteria bacterium]